MKRASAFDYLADWGSPPDRLRDLVRPGTLAVARCESIFFESSAVAILDLTFDDGSRTAILPGVAVDASRLATRSGSSIWWPSQIEALGLRAAVEAIEAEIMPWLRTLVRGRPIAGESIRTYRACAAFEAARERGDLGAAPLSHVLAGLAPFVYAMRFTRDRAVELRCAHAARGAAVLRDSAASIAFSGDAAGCAWFGVAPATAEGRPDVLIVEDAAADEPGLGTVVLRSAAGPLAAPWRVVPIPHPVPLDLPFTFDEADAPAVGWFAVRSTGADARPHRSALQPQRAGGSAGRIALLLRPDARVAPDADSDEAEAIAEALQSIGIATALCTSDDEVRAFAPDLVHAFVAHDDMRWHGAAGRLRAFAVPYVVTLEPLAVYSQWEEQALSMLANTIDDDDRERFAPYFARRGLHLPPGDAPLAMPPSLIARNDAETRTLLDGAAAVFCVNSAAGLRARLGLRESLPISSVGTLLADEPPEDDVSALVPHEPFVLAHGPLLLRNHQLSLAMPAGRPAVPLVIAGTISDVLYAARIQRRAARGTIVIADPTPGTVAALYRRAVAFVEPSLRPSGVGRLARAIASGMLPILPTSSPLAPLIAPEGLLYDSLQFEGIRPAIDAAARDPNRSQKVASLASRLAPLWAPEPGFRAILAGYAQAAQTVAR